jgi:hypothetical protein
LAGNYIRLRDDQANWSERESLLWAALMLDEELPQQIGGVDFVSRTPSDPFWQGLTAWKGVASTVHSVENHVRILSAVRVFETVDACCNASIDRVSATLVAPRPTRHPIPNALVGDEWVARSVKRHHWHRFGVATPIPGQRSGQKQQPLF